MSDIQAAQVAAGEAAVMQRLRERGLLPQLPQDPKDAEIERLRTSVKDMIGAWESIPAMTSLPVQTVQDWLSGPMKKAIDGLRMAVAQPNT